MVKSQAVLIGPKASRSEDVLVGAYGSSPLILCFFSMKWGITLQQKEDWRSGSKGVKREGVK